MASASPTMRARDIHPDDLVNLAARFHTLYQRHDVEACWPWTGALSGAGYGRIFSKHDGRKSMWYAHRIAWVIANGKPLTGGLTVDHLCRNRRCVNPAHLDAVTVAENTRRGVTARLGGLLTSDELKRRASDRNRRWRESNPEKVEAAIVRRADCPMCGKNLRARSLPEHRRRMHPASRAA